MLSSKSILPVSKRGEIALTLTLISLGIMLIGTAFGGISLQNQKNTQTKAVVNCSYYGYGRIKGHDKKGNPVSIANSSLGTNLGVRNLETQGFIPFKDDNLFVISEYNNPNFTLAPYKDHDMASIKLEGLDTTKYRITDVYASNLEGGKGGENVSTSYSADKMTIKNLEVTCGVKVTYTWEVAPITTQTTPTPGPLRNITVKPGSPTVVPISPPVCKYTAQVQVIKEDSKGKQTILTLSENRKNNSNKVLFGVRNDKLIQGLFGIHRQNGQDINIGDRAEYSYINENEPFRDNFPTNTKLYYKNESATVTLTGLNPQFIIKRAFCDELDPRYGGCPKNIPDVKTTQTPETITGFKPNCNVDINYGWVIYDPTDTFPSPTIGAIRFPTGFTPTGGSVTAIPYPTKVSVSTAPQPTAIKAPPITSGITPVPSDVISFPTRAPTFPTRIPTQIPSPSVPTPSVPANPRGQYISAFCTEKDAYVIGLNALKNTNYGNAKRLFIGGRPGNSNLYTPYRSYIQFDLQNSEFLSRKPIIKKVELGLADTEDDPTTYTEKLRFPITAKKVLQPWSESNITWNTQPSVGSIVATQFINSAREITRFNLPASLVQEWVDDPSSNNGLLLIGTEDESVEDIPVRSFYASEEVSNAGQTRITCMRVEYDGGIKISASKIPLTRKDINHDRIINGIDFALMVAQIGKRGINVAADLNNDGIVNALDVSAVIASIGQRTD